MKLLYTVQCTRTCTLYIHLDVGHSKGWHLGYGDQVYHLQVKKYVNIGNIGNTF